MKTITSQETPPAELVERVRALKQWMPYRICWGAFMPGNPSDMLTGAHYDRRKLNAALRKGYAAFVI